MRYRLWVRFLCLSWMLGFCSSLLANKPILNIQHWTTAQGARVYFVHRPEIPMVDIQLAFAAGSAYDGEHPGLAYCVNAMLDQGTEAHNADQIAATFDRLGAQTGMSVTRDMALISLRTVTDPHYFQPALDVFEETLTDSAFPERAVSRVKQQIQAGIQAKEQQPMSVAADAFYQALYGSTPYGHPLMGTTKSVEDFTRETLRGFYHQYYVAKNANVIIVGDLTRSQAEQVAESLTAHLPIGEKARRLSKLPNSQSMKKALRFPAKQSSIILGQVAATRETMDYFPLMLGNQVLGGGTMTSILFNQVRNERGLVYGVSSQFNWLRYRGPFAVVLQTRSEKAKEALAVTRAVLKTFIKNGPSAEQLKAAKRNLLGSFPLQIAKNSQIEGILTRIAFYDLPLNYLDTYRDKINAVTSQQIQQAFSKWLDPNKMTTIIVGPSS